MVSSKKITTKQFFYSEELSDHGPKNLKHRVTESGTVWVAIRV